MSTIYSTQQFAADGDVIIDTYLKPIMNPRYERIESNASVSWLRSRLKKRKEYLYEQQQPSHPQ